MKRRLLQILLLLLFVSPIVVTATTGSLATYTKTLDSLYGSLELVPEDDKPQAENFPMLLVDVIKELVGEDDTLFRNTYDSQAYGIEDAAVTTIMDYLTEEYNIYEEAWSAKKKNNSDYIIAWSPYGFPSGTQEGDMLLCIRYNANRDTYTVAYVDITEEELNGEYYMTFNEKGYFDAHKKYYKEFDGVEQTSETKADFDLAYKIYVDAVEEYGFYY